MDKCGFEWWARRLAPPPGVKVISVKQVCVKDKNHKDDHMSAGKVALPKYEKRAD